MEITDWIISLTRSAWICLALAAVSALIALSPWGRRRDWRMEFFGGWLVGFLGILIVFCALGAVGLVYGDIGSRAIKNGLQRVEPDTR